MKRLGVPLLVGIAAAAGFLVGREWAPSRGGVAEVEQAAVGALASPVEIDLPALPERPVRNLILAVADGFGIPEITATRLRAFGPDGRFVFERLPETGLVLTHPSDRLVAKSDSSANAMATGQRTRVGRIGLGDDGARLATLLERAAAAGLATGIVTTSQVFDATPAAFYAHVDDRYDHDEIVRQLTTAPVDLVAGGGAERFDHATLAAARERGVAVATTIEAMNAAAELPLWALFPGKRLGEKPERPALDDLVARALDLLPAEAARRGAGFFLLFEDEGTDNAAHATDLDRLTRAALRFDAAVARAARFTAADGETLLVVVADHATGGVVVEDGRERRTTMKVTWVTDEHSAEPVALFAYGPENALRPLAGQLDQPELGRRLGRLLLPSDG